jgi:hypothetical protein
VATKYSTSLAIKEVQIKSTVRYLITIKIVNVKKTKVTNANEDMEKRDSYNVGKNKVIVLNLNH